MLLRNYIIAYFDSLAWNRKSQVLKTVKKCLCKEKPPNKTMIPIYHNTCYSTSKMKNDLKIKKAMQTPKMKYLKE